MDPVVITSILTALVATLTGERAYQFVRLRRNGNGTATKADIKGLHKRLDILDENFDQLSQQVQRHLGYHEGLRER